MLAFTNTFEFININTGFHSTVFSGVHIMLLSAATYGKQFVVDHGFQFYLTQNLQVIFTGSVVNL